MVKDH